MALSENTATQDECAESEVASVAWSPYLDDIAYGVEGHLDLITGQIMTKTVVERTAAIGRGLDIPEEQITKWANARLKLSIERINTLQYLVKKLERSAAAQVALGMTELYWSNPDKGSFLDVRDE